MMPARCVAEIAKAAGLREDQVVHRLRHGLCAAHGIGHNRDDAWVITIVLPEGVPAEAAAKGKRAPKIATADVSTGSRRRRTRSRSEHNGPEPISSRPA